ncbi:MAG TPA: glycoside hydrolase family 6 protein [Kineosporiaceae bacterium]|nr:glycoside hydrolase family 6 protein [Kineosporiaceae bacterium]
MSLRRSRPSPSSRRHSRRRRSLALAATAALAVALGAGVVAAPAAAASTTSTTNSQGHRRDVRFYVPPPDPGAVQQIRSLVRSGDLKDAVGIARMVTTPQAVWFNGGTPAQVRRDVHRTVQAAARRHAVPILVAYNLPFRDCAQYSAGGATDTDAYLRWISAFAAGIGRRPAVVILEPDGLGIIPNNTDLNGAKEWCQPTAPGATPQERYRALNGAVDRLGAHSATKVYLDGTHSAWLGVGDIADRLVKAGVQRARGFFLNVSNFQTTSRQLRYGTWISECIAYATAVSDDAARTARFKACANQYYPADPNDESTWYKTDQWYAANLGSAVPTAHFVIDTSRNGRGPWEAPADHPAGDPEVWCNPPDRGLGLRPTTRTGNPLADAFLWIKTPGQSDGQCHRWTSGPVDPVRGIVDPPAGAWFPQMAIELVRNADPPIVR